MGGGGFAPISKAVLSALVDRRPAIAASSPIAARAAALKGPMTSSELAALVHLGQELTVVPEFFTRPITVANALASATKGQATTLIANQKAKVTSPLGTWIVELDGKMPGGAPIIEVGSPPVTKANDKALLALVPKLHSFGDALASVGGGHIHVDGAAFLVSPPLLARFLSFYLAVEPAVLSRFRHPARSHAARGLTERADAKALRQALSDLADCTPAQLPAALTTALDDHGIDRNSALNLLSLAGVASGNKKSKGTVELRLFDSPTSVEEARAQRGFVRALLTATFGKGPAPSTDTVVSDIADAEALLADAA